MTRRHFGLLAASVALVGMALSTAQVRGQTSTSSTSTSTSTTAGSQMAGIEIDARGVLTVRRYTDPGLKTLYRRIAEARSTLPRAVCRASALRKISLNRLETAVKACLDRGEKPGEEIRYLAGLTRLRYVFYYPDTKDIVLAGPAEGWMTDLSGRVRGVETWAPVIELQDLVVALRAFPPGGKETPLISCSIDPTPQGLANLQAFLRSLGSRAVPGQTQFIVNGLRQSLGLQVVTIKGIPASTHYAQVLVEADYRMKLIGIGLERPRIRLASYVDLAQPGRVSQNALQRWWFVPNYDCVRVSEDKLGMELVGDGVKLVGADELVTRDGARVASAHVDPAGKRFVEGFTAKYAQLAAVTPVYAQLRNLIDLAVAAAFIQEQDYYGKAGWSMSVLGEETKFPVHTAAAPQQVESAVASVWRGNRLMTPIGGGVRIEPKQALDPDKMLADDQSKVRSQREKISLSHLAPGQWWWD